MLLRSKFNVKFVTKTLSFQLIRSRCTCFGHWSELWRPLSENIELENVGFSRPETWTVRKQRAILKASLVFARFWNCEGGNHRLRWLCRTSTDWIWESQILRAASLREGKKTHFTKSYFMQFVPTEIRTTGRCICINVLAIIIIQRQDDRELACEPQTHFQSSLLSLRKIASANPSDKTISVT